jgi:hypothetical protein
MGGGGGRRGRRSRQSLPYLGLKCDGYCVSYWVQFELCGKFVRFGQHFSIAVASSLSNRHSPHGCNTGPAMHMFTKSQGTPIREDGGVGRVCGRVFHLIKFEPGHTISSISTEALEAKPFATAMSKAGAPSSLAMSRRRP